MQGPNTLARWIPAFFLCGPFVDMENAQDQEALLEQEYEVRKTCIDQYCGAWESLWF